MSGAPELVMEELTGGYGDIVVVRNFSANVTPGHVVFITGRNGVGKTTLVKLVAGHLPAMSGTVTFGGLNLLNEPAHSRRAAGVGYAPQEAVVFDNLTVRENLTLQYADRDLSRYVSLFELLSTSARAQGAAGGHAVRWRKEAAVLLPRHGRGNRTRDPGRTDRGRAA